MVSKGLRGPSGPPDTSPQGPGVRGEMPEKPAPPGTAEAVCVHLWLVVRSDPPPLPQSCSSWTGRLPRPSLPKPRRPPSPASASFFLLLAIPATWKGSPRSLAPGSLARRPCLRVCRVVVVAGWGWGLHVGWAVLLRKEPQPQSQGLGGGGREWRSGLLCGHVALDPG